MVGYMKKMLQTDASVLLATGEKHWKSNEQIRKLMNVSNLQAELHYRRLNWLRDIIKFPEDNVQLRAALIGKLQIDEQNQQRRNPWFQQFVDAVNALALAVNRTITLDEDLVTYGDQLLFDPVYMHWIFLISLKKVRSYLDPVPPVVELADSPEVLVQCGYVFPDGSVCTYENTVHAVNSHRTSQHPQTNF